MSMDRFENVTAIKKANVYFEGKVTSRTVLFADGSKKTLGIMLPGQYEFGTGLKEHMEILAGEVRVLLPDSSEEVVYKEGQSFEVSANSTFRISVIQIADYCCSYISE